MKNFKLKFHSFTWADVVVLCVILIQIILTLCYYRSDADDSFYVSNVMLFQKSSVLNIYDSSFGITSLGTVPMYDFQIWEAWMAVFSWMLGVDGATMMHTILIPGLLVLSSSAYIFLGRTLFDDNTKAKIFFALQSAFLLMGGYAVYSQGSFLLSRLWQGKAVYLHIVLPVMIAFLLKSIKVARKYLFAETAICMLAGMALNPTSLYVMGFQLLFMMLAIAIVKKKPKYMFHAIPSVMIAGFFTLMIYFRTSKFSGQIEAASQISDTFVIDTFRNFWGSGMLYFYLFLLSTAWILWKGDIIGKVYFVFTPILLLLVVWNPWLGKYVAEKVTMVPSYWRVFWLIPVGASVSYGIILLADKVKNSCSRVLALLIGTLLLIIPGKWMFTWNNWFVPTNNVQKVPDEVMNFKGSYLENANYPVVLGCDAFSTTLRQVTTNVELIYSRQQYILDLFLYRGEEQSAEDRSILMKFANNQLDDFSRVAELLGEYNVKYVIIKEDQQSMDYLQEHGWETLDKDGEYVIWEKI